MMTKHLQGWAETISPMQIGGFQKRQNCRLWVDKAWHEKKYQATGTDLHSAFDQIEGNDSCVCGATAQNPTKAAQDEILLRAELTTVSL